MSLVLFSYPFIFPSLCIAEYIKMLYNSTLAFDHCQLTRGVCLQAGSRNMGRYTWIDGTIHVDALVLWKNIQNELHALL